MNVEDVAKYHDGEEAKWMTTAREKRQELDGLPDGYFRSVVERRASEADVQAGFHRGAADLIRRLTHSSC